MLINLSSLTALTLGAASLVSAQVPFPVTGVNVAQGQAVPLRKNINDLQTNGGPEWDLYIRALLEFQKQDANDPLSYFQVAGIHGKPFIEWDGSGGRRSDGWQGYCPHGERIFLTWHRPYVMLYEQLLVATAQRLARDYPQRYRAQYVEAANNLRCPFWDWGSGGVPKATVPETMMVNIPSGSGLKKTSVDNPLYTFKFPQEALNGDFGDFDSEKRTQMFRCPSPNSYPDSANALLAKRPYKSMVYDAFTKAASFDQFSSTGASGGTSLEQIHNAIHWDAGCGGQFLAAEFSGFDPLFMLHHSNVDRFWAYWQAMQPDSPLFNTSYAGGARWSTPSGTSISTESPLQPFLSDMINFHTSESVSSIKGFGYTYEGLEYWEKDEAQMQTDATRLINQLYSDNSTVSSRSVKVNSLGQGCYTRFFVRVSLEVEEVERPCSIDLYLHGQKVDGHVVMQQPACGTAYGEYSIDHVVKETMNLDLEPDHLVSSILKGFQVQITKHDGTIIPIETVPSLKIEIEDVEVTPPTDDCELPTYDKSRSRIAPLVQKPVSCECEDDDNHDKKHGSGTFGI
ncbi:hypothetical protein BGZ63DRAFT_345976 [Mariannaea sp. PMI_226]|nr:hypothetical protein BGZ63DRAFT_345976 [Mariannaea sp. PMI_226]